MVFTLTINPNQL